MKTYSSFHCKEKKQQPENVLVIFCQDIICQVYRHTLTLKYRQDTSKINMKISFISTQYIGPYFYGFFI